VIGSCSLWPQALTAILTGSEPCTYRLSHLSYPGVPIPLGAAPCQLRLRSRLTCLDLQASTAIVQALSPVGLGLLPCTYKLAHLSYPGVPVPLGAAPCQFRLRSRLTCLSLQGLAPIVQALSPVSLGHLPCTYRLARLAYPLPPPALPLNPPLTYPLPPPVLPFSPHLCYPLTPT
jgi:hypothetical protein